MSASCRTTSTFSPRQMFGAACQFWVRSDLGVTTRAPPNEAYVGGVVDQSGYGNDLSVGVTGALYTPKSPIGMSALTGAPSNYLKKSNPTLTTGSAARAAFCVVSFSTFASSSRPFAFNYGGSGVVMAFHSDSTEGGAISIVTEANWQETFVIPPLNRPLLLGAVYDGSGNLDVWLNARLLKRFTSVTMTQTCDAINVCGGAFNHNGNFYEGIYLAGSITPDDRRSIERYALNRYGI